MITELEQRLTALRQRMKEAKIDGMLLQSRLSSLYLSGFPCSNSIVLITRKQGLFFTDFRYIVTANQLIKHLEVVQIPQRALDGVVSVASKLKLNRIGFEEGIQFGEYQSLAKAFQSVAELVPSGGIIKSLRMRKSPREIRQIAANQSLNQELFKAAVSNVHNSDSESDIRNFILRQIIDRGCEEAFHSIIATGANSALPHAVPGKTRVKKNSFLLFDMGVKKNHYYSDMTRTVAVGEKLPQQLKEIYDVVQSAQQLALKAVSAGVACRDIDNVARAYIKDAGYGDYFGHGLGHGVGLEIHEGPTLNPTTNDILETGMVITIEPGIYLPGIGGVRIEDLLVVTERGYRNLTSLDKNLLHIL